MKIDNNNFISTPKIFFFWAMLFYCALTLTGILTHEPWYDEAQAWLISQDLNFIELLNYMKDEGHLFIWYTLLMPFTKLNMSYPMPMLVLNMLFMWGAVYVLWTKFPFNNLIKLLITFSLPICYQYAVVARCYSVGIFLLFVLVAFYPEKLKKPYLYASLIILCANTSVMALVGAAAFGLLFFIDYIVNNKSFYKSKQFWLLFLIALFGISLILYQLLGSGEQLKVLSTFHTHDTAFNTFVNTLSYGISFFNTDIYTVPYIISAIFVICSLLTFVRSFRTLFFFLITFIMLSLIFIFIYNAEFWHQYFYYIYFIISLALFKFEDKSRGIFYKILIIFLLIVSFNGCFMSYDSYNMEINGDFSESKKFSELVINNKDVVKSDLIIGDMFSRTFVPYFRNKDIHAIDIYTNREVSFFDHSKNYPWGLDIIDDCINNQNNNNDIYLIISTTSTFDDLESEKYDFELVSYVEPSYLVKLIPKK